MKLPAIVRFCHGWERHTEVVGQQVARHLEQPGPGVLQVTKPLALTQGFQKQVLQQVVCQR